MPPLLWNRGCAGENQTLITGVHGKEFRRVDNRENYRVTWASAWPVIGESFDRACAGETMYLEHQRMFLKRLGGSLKETFFT